MSNRVHPLFEQILAGYNCSMKVMQARMAEDDAQAARVDARLPGIGDSIRADNFNAVERAAFWTSLRGESEGIATLYRETINTNSCTRAIALYTLEALREAWRNAGDIRDFLRDNKLCPRCCGEGRLDAPVRPVMTGTPVLSGWEPCDLCRVEEENE